MLLRPLRCDGVLEKPVVAGKQDWSYARDARTPVVKEGGSWNAAALKQISAGSVIGLIGGLAVGVFSKPLAVILGLLLFGLQFVESRGIHVIPYSSLQSHIKSINLRSLVQDNVAFKLSLGITFALAGFAEF